MSSDPKSSFDLDHHIDSLFNCVSYGLNGMVVNNVLTDKSIVDNILSRIMSVIQTEPSLVEIDSPVSVCGDIHGQFTDLLRIFDMLGRPPTQSYIFLGDYIDRGPNSLEVICLLFLLKLRYPKQIHLLRGNHECSSINRIYGFLQEINKRFSNEESRVLYSDFQNAFNWMPLAGLIGNRILCVHGGISPYLNTIDQLRCIKRPMEPDLYGLEVDLLWADPNKSMPTTSKDQRFKPSVRGISYEFNERAVHEICEQMGIEIVVRGHQVVMDGYEFFANRHLVTIFSAPNYCGTFGNNGAIMIIKDDYSCSFNQLLPIEGTPVNKSVRLNEVTIDNDF